MNRRSPIEAVVFDFAGVLTTSPWDAMAEAGRGDLELLIGPYDQDGDHPWHQVERGELGIGEWMTAVTEMGRERGVEVDFTPLQALMSEMRVHEQVVARVASLRTEGYRLGLITNNLREAADTWRSMVPVDDLFDLVVDSSAVGMRKPNPAIYHHTLAGLGGVVPERAVFLDDTPGNVAGARRVGMHAILVADPDEALAELDALLALAS